MHPSVRVLNARKPLINFIGKRTWPSSPESQHAHPAAPEELKKSFRDFLKKFKASSSTASSSPSPSSGSTGKKSGSKEAFGEFWEAPSRFWRPRVREIEEAEMDAISSGGASLH